MTALAPDAIAARLRTAFPATEARASDNGQPWVLVPADQVVAVTRFLRDDPDLSFDQLLDLTGYDLLKYPATPPSDAIAGVSESLWVSSTIDAATSRSASPCSRAWWAQKCSSPPDWSSTRR